MLTAMIGLVGRSQRRYGGYIVHVGIVLMFLGFAGEGFKQEEQALLKPGEQFTVGHFTVRHDALRVTSDAQKQMITGHVSVFDDGKLIGEMEPAKWFFDKHEEEPTTEVAIRRGLGEDLYIVLAGYDAAEQSATYAVTVNPLVNWIWLGFGDHGARHRPGAAAGDGVRVRRGEGAVRRRDRVDDPAAGAARRACVGAQTPQAVRSRRCASSSKGRSSAPAAAAGR